MALTTTAKTCLMVAVTVFAILLVLATAEGAVRVRQWMNYGSFRHLADAYTVDPKTNLRVPTPGSESANIRINSLGFRGPELDQPKPEGRLRIAFLGASTTYCAEVSSNAMTWPHLVAETLRSG